MSPEDCKEVCVTFSGSQLRSLIAIDSIFVTKPIAQRMSALKVFRCLGNGTQPQAAFKVRKL